MKNQREDYIEVYENKLTPETCNAIINFFNQNALWDTSTFSNNKENNNDILNTLNPNSFLK